MTGIATLLLRGGIFTVFFFMLPLGFAAYSYGLRITWFSAILFTVINLFYTLTFRIAQGIPPEAGILDFFTITVLTLIFTWIVSPPLFLSFKLPGAFRMIIGSSLGALLFIFIFLRQIAEPVFINQVEAITNTFFSFNLGEEILVDDILYLMMDIMLRGGSLLSCIIIFFLNRHLGLMISRLFRKEKGKPVFVAFHVYPVFIWIFSITLILLVFTSISGLLIPEILLWNILLICAMLYIAQGMGILQFFMTRPQTPPFLRLGLIIVIIGFILSTVLNTVLIVGLLLLGIVENWLPIRTAGIKEPPSTPEAGDKGD